MEILTGNAFGFMRAVQVMDVFMVAHCPRRVGDAKPCGDAAGGRAAKGAERARRGA